MTNELAIQEMLTVASHLKQTSRGEAVMMGVAALEKQIPKKPIKRKDMINYWSYCPNCDSDCIGYVNDSGVHNFCENCGQALDWSEDNDLDGNNSR